MPIVTRGASSPSKSPTRKGTSPDRNNPRVPITPARPSPPGRPAEPDAKPRDELGHWLPVVLSPADEAEAQDRRDANGVVKFGDVLDALADVPDAGDAVDEIRGKIMFQGNPRVRVKVARSPGNVALGIGPSVQRRLGADFALPPIASTKAGAVKPKKKTDSQRLRR